MASGDRLERRRWWNALAIALLVLYLVGIGLFCYAALTGPPGGRASPIVQTPLKAYGTPDAWWPIALQLALGLGAFFAYYGPRRRETRSFSLLITGGLGVSTIVLGVLSAWNCTDQESPFFAPLTITVGLLLGNTPTFVGACASVQAFPPGLQVARLFGPLLLVIAALGIVATLFRTQLDRLIVRFSRSLVVLIGLSDEALPLLRRLADDLPDRSVLAVLVEDADHPLTKLARNIGARVVVCDLEKADAIRVLVLRRNRFKVLALYVVSADVSANLAWAKQFRDIAKKRKTASGHSLPRMTARIDDPWQAEYWRRTNAYRTPAEVGSDEVRWVTDALSIHEVTATLLMVDVEAKPHDRLAVVGASPLALAICAELAQRQREGAILHTRPRPSFSELMLVGPDANSLYDQHRIRQARFGNSAESGSISVELVDPAEPALARLLESASSPAVIFADDLVGSRKDDLSATLLAALHPTWTIYHIDAAAQGLAAPIMERLYPFGLTIEPPPGAPVDSWERAARVVHQTYLLSLGHDANPRLPAQRSWEDLSSFYRASNVRLVTATLAGAEAVGRSWGPAPTARSDEVTTSILPDQLRQLAKLEHASWLQFYRENRWSYGSPRNDARRRHDAMVSWGPLPENYKKRAIGNVKDALSILYALGYRSYRTADRPWSKVSRRGEVTATVLASDWRWQAKTGDWLQARAGDYQVRNDEGEAWSVEPEIFNRTYEHVGHDRWRRIGQVWAQRAVPDELVITLEGPVTAKSGDWVIKGTAGEQWITSATHFAKSYRVPTAS